MRQMTLKAGALLGAAFLLSGCGTTPSPSVDLTSFWQQPALQKPVYNIFPRSPGSLACRIRHGGLDISGGFYDGTCATTVATPTSQDLRTLPTAEKGQAWRTVVLTESSRAPRFSASFRFVVSRKERVLGSSVRGSPPQFWK